MTQTPPRALVQGKVGPLRFRKLDESILITNDWGAWALLDPARFDDLLQGKLSADSSLHAELSEKGFIPGGLSSEDIGERMRARYRWLEQGPSLHILRLTEAKADGELERMSAETAERCLEVALGTSSPRLVLRFEGPEALSNGDILERITLLAEQRAKDLGKTVTYELRGDLKGLDAARRDWLVEKRFAIWARMDATTLDDGDAPIREHVRDLVGAYRALPEGEVVPPVGLVLTLRPETLELHPTLVRAVRALDCEQLHLELPPPTPAGVDPEASVSPEQWLSFYEATLDALLELSLEGRRVLERTTALEAARIFNEGGLHPQAPSSPTTDAIGTLCYAVDGMVCTSELGQRLYARGDATFALGMASEKSYGELMGHPTVRALVVGSILQGQPSCVDCSFLPYCGQSPAHNHSEQGSLQGRMPDSRWCRVMTGLHERIFRRLASGGETRKAIEEWARRVGF